jgi:hypothetical protein
VAISSSWFFNFANSMAIIASWSFRSSHCLNFFSRNSANSFSCWL